MRREPPHELQVDIRACDAYGYCAELLPGIVERDEWGYPIILREIDAHRLAEARRAVLTCPRVALTLAAREREPAPAAG